MTLIKNIIVISDIHAGCKVALCPPTVALDLGGSYRCSKAQALLYCWWLEFWDDWVPRATHGEPYAVVFNGDCIDGVHHNSTTQISHDIGDQTHLAYTLLKPVVEKCEGRYYHIRGTEAHVGPSGVNEEALAKRLGAVPNDEGQCARFELWKNVGEGLCHFTHHISSFSSARSETGAVNRELSDMFEQAGRWRNQAPDIVVRSHRHACSEIRIPSSIGYSSAFTTPSWQLKTPYVFKISGGRIQEPQIGGSLIRQGDEELHTRHWIRTTGRSRVE